MDILEKTGKQITICSPSFSDQDVLDYIARISKDLMTLADSEGFDFLAYFLSMAHQESIDILHKSKASEQLMVKKI